MRKKRAVSLLIFVGIIVIATGMLLIFKNDLFVFRNNKPIYTKEEPVLTKLGFDFTKKDLIEKMGKPKKVKKEWWGAYGDYVEYCYYDWGNLCLAPSIKKHSFYVIFAEINKRGIKGPREIEVGDSYKRVINKFRYDPKKVDDKEYLYFVTDKYGVKKYGSIIYNNEKKIESIYYQDSSYYVIEFKISKGKVKQILVHYHDT